MAYKISTKGGETYKASGVDQVGPFVKMTFWDGELRIPGGEVTKIESVGLTGVTEFQALLIVFLIALILALIFLV